MLAQFVGWWTPKRAGLSLAVGVGTIGLVAVVTWISALPPHAILSQASDGLEEALDHSIVDSMRDFQIWNRINIAVQSATILLGLTATLLTASTTTDNTQHLKTATVTVTALTAALVAVQSTFHLRENIRTDLTAFARLVDLEMDYVSQRVKVGGNDLNLALLRRDTERKLTQIRAERMMSLASIGGGVAEPARDDVKRNGAE